MRYNVKGLKTYYINMDSEPNKKEYTEKVLNKLGFTNYTRFPGVVDHKFKRAIKSHHKLLSSDIKVPFTVLEDDILYKETNKFTFDIPDKADALYLGISNLGYCLDYTGRFVMYKPVPNNKDILRVYNMLIAHATVYLTEDYRNMVRRCCEYHLEENPNKAFDLSVAEVMKYYRVYALNEPMFCQSGNNKKITDSILTQVGVTGRKAVEVYNSLMKCRSHSNERMIKNKHPQFAPFRYNGMKIIDS